MPARFMVRFTNSFGGKEQQMTGESETIALLKRLPQLGAHSISVVAPNGDTWSGEETIDRLSMV